MTAMPLPKNAAYWTTHEPASAYHSVDAVSSSGVNLLLKSPRLFEAVYVLCQKIQEDKDTNALDVGTAGHCWALESDKWPDTIAIYPAEVLDKNGNATTKLAKDWKAQQNGKVILKEEDFDRVRAMARALRSHPIAGAMIEKASDRELSIYWRCPITGLPRKSRLDLLTTWNGRKLIADLKTASDHSPDGFGRAMHKWGYHIQSAFYQDAAEAAGFARREFVFVVVNSKPPHVVRVHHPDSRATQLARDQIDGALRDIADRMLSGDWSEVGEREVCEVSLPPWAFQEGE